MKLKQIKPVLENEGYSFMVDRLNKMIQTSAYIFEDSKTVITLYRKYNETYEKKYPGYRICTFRKPDAFNTKEELLETTEKILKHKYLEPHIISYNVEKWADEHRNNLTDAETAFKNLLDRNSIPYKMQVPLMLSHSYIADFVLYDKVVVEIDGDYHTTKTQRIKDTRRTRELNKNGYLVLRCWNSEAMSGKFKNELLQKIIS